MKAWDFTMKEWDVFEKKYVHSIIHTQSELYVSSWSMTRWTYVLTYMVHASL